MAGNLKRDAETYAEWQIDYLKVRSLCLRAKQFTISGRALALLADILQKAALQVDGCYADTEEFAEAYSLLEKFLNSTGRPITYSCSWPAYLPDPVRTGFQVLNIA